jgi:hypothetical protein
MSQQPPPDPNLIMAQSQMELSKVKGQQLQVDLQKSQQEMYLKQGELELKRAVETEKANLAQQKLQIESELEAVKIQNAKNEKLLSAVLEQLQNLGQNQFQAPQNLPGQLNVLPNN